MCSRPAAETDPLLKSHGAVPCELCHTQGKQILHETATRKAVQGKQVLQPSKGKQVLYPREGRQRVKLDATYRRRRSCIQDKENSSTP